MCEYSIPHIPRSDMTAMHFYALVQNVKFTHLRGKKTYIVILPLNWVTLFSYWPILQFSCCQMKIFIVFSETTGLVFSSAMPSQASIFFFPYNKLYIKAQRAGHA